MLMQHHFHIEYTQLPSNIIKNKHSSLNKQCSSNNNLRAHIHMHTQIHAQSIQGIPIELPDDMMKSKFLDWTTMHNNVHGTQ